MDHGYEAECDPDGTGLPPQAVEGGGEPRRPRPAPPKPSYVQDALSRLVVAAPLFARLTGSGSRGGDPQDGSIRLRAGFGDRSPVVTSDDSGPVVHTTGGGWNRASGSWRRP